jgi:hypothetical protein
VKTTRPQFEATASAADLCRSALEVSGPESRQAFVRSFSDALQRGAMDADAAFYLFCLADGAEAFHTRGLRLPSEHTVLYVGCVSFQDKAQRCAPDGVTLPDALPRAQRGRQVLLAMDRQAVPA